MSQPEKATEAPQEPAAALPQSNVLSYLTTLSSPTRVRNAACIGMRLVAIWYAILASIFGTLAVVIVLANLDEAVPFWRAVRSSAFPGFFASCGAALGIAQWFLAGPVKLGDSKACRLASPALIPAAIATFLASLIPIGIMGATIYGDGEHSPAVNVLIYIPCALFAVGFAACGLLIADLSRCLRWIARNPMVEKPPVPFLPINPNP